MVSCVLRFNLKSLLAIIGICCLALAYASGPVAQQNAIRTIVHNAGGRVIYDHELINGQIDAWAAGGGQPLQSPSALTLWIDKSIGPDWFNDIAMIWFDSGMSTNRLNDDVLIQIGRLNCLQGLVVPPTCCNRNVGYVPVTDRGVAALSELNNLVNLDLSNTQLSDSGVRHLVGLRKLKNLQLAYTYVSDEGAKALVELKELEMLVLTGTQIGDDGLRALEQIRTLKTLYVIETNVTNAGLSHFQAAQPQCYVADDG